MKTILVDAVYTFVSDQGVINKNLNALLEQFPNPKIILTNAPYERFEQYGLNNVPYEVFTLQKDPEKTDPLYFKKMLAHFNLTADDVVYFEHNLEAVESARSVGIVTHHFDKETRDLDELKKFLDENIG